MSRRGSAQKEVYYEVEEIIGRRGDKTDREYKVKWKGYSEADSTWEPLENVIMVMDLVTAYDSRIDKRSGDEGGSKKVQHVPKPLSSRDRNQAMSERDRHLDSDDDGREVKHKFLIVDKKQKGEKVIRSNQKKPLIHHISIGSSSRSSSSSSRQSESEDHLASKSQKKGKVSLTTPEKRLVPKMPEKQKVQSPPKKLQLPQKQPRKEDAQLIQRDPPSTKIPKPQQKGKAPTPFTIIPNQKDLRPNPIPLSRSYPIPSHPQNTPRRPLRINHLVRKDNEILYQLQYEHKKGTSFLELSNYTSIPKQFKGMVVEYYQKTILLLSQQKQKEEERHQKQVLAKKQSLEKKKERNSLHQST